MSGDYYALIIRFPPENNMAACLVVNEKACLFQCRNDLTGSYGGQAWHQAVSSVTLN